MDKSEMIMVVFAAAAAGAVLGPAGLVVAAIAAGIWWLYRESRQSLVDQKFKKVSGHYTIPLAIPDFDNLICDISYEAMSGVYRIVAIRHEYHEDDIFEKIPAEHSSLVDRQIRDFLKKRRAEGGISKDYSEFF